MARYSQECTASQTSLRLWRSYLRTQPVRVGLPRLRHPRGRAHPPAGGAPSISRFRDRVRQCVCRQQLRPENPAPPVNAAGEGAGTVRPALQSPTDGSRKRLQPRKDAELPCRGGDGGRYGNRLRFIKTCRSDNPGPHRISWSLRRHLFTASALYAHRQAHRLPEPMSKIVRSHQYCINNHFKYYIIINFITIH